MITLAAITQFDAGPLEPGNRSVSARNKFQGAKAANSNLDNVYAQVFYTNAPIFSRLDYFPSLRVKNGLMRSHAAVCDSVPTF
jgi:hypothetical protein